jgi:glycosyltransferase involved in cell wall biosynthesis
MAVPVSKQKCKKNISVYTTSDFPTGGAPENFVRQMAIGLVENEAEVRIIRLRGRTYGGENYTRIHSSNFLFCKTPKNEIIKIIELLLIIFYTPFSVLVDKLINKTDVILLYGIEYSYNNIPFLITSKLLKIKIFRIITDYYGMKSIVPIWWKTPKQFFYYLQFKYIDKWMDGLIVLSSFLEKNAIRNNVNPHKIILLPNFIDLSFSDFSINESTIVRIGFFGSSTIERGFYDLLEAFKIVHQKHSNTLLIISGILPEGIISALKPHLAGLNNEVQFTGYLSNEELHRMQQSCDILVNPPKITIGSEAGFPTKLGEYFAKRKPVVSTKTGDIKSYFTDKNELVLVEPDNPGSLANGIIYLIENKLNAQQIGINGYNWAKENLDYKSNSIRLLKFINEI